MSISNSVSAEYLKNLSAMNSITCHSRVSRSDGGGRRTTYNRAGNIADMSDRNVDRGCNTHKVGNAGSSSGTGKTLGLGQSFYEILLEQQLEQIKQLATGQESGTQDVNLQKADGESKSDVKQGKADNSSISQSTQLLCQKLFMQQASLLSYQMNLGFGNQNLYGMNYLGGLF